MWVQDSGCAGKKITESYQPSPTNSRSLGSFAILRLLSSDSYQTTLMCRLIWVFTWHTCPKLHHLELWLKYAKSEGPHQVLHLCSPVRAVLVAGLEQLKISKRSTHFQLHFQSLLSHFWLHFGVCQIEISVFSIILVKEFPYCNCQRQLLLYFEHNKWHTNIAYTCWTYMRISITIINSNIV